MDQINKTVLNSCIEPQPACGLMTQGRKFITDFILIV